MRFYTTNKMLTMPQAGSRSNSETGHRFAGQLLAQAEALQQDPVARNIVVAEILQQTTALADQLD